MSTPAADALLGSIAELRRAFRDGSLDPREVCAAALDRARRADPALRAYHVITDDLAAEQAARAVAAYAAGDETDRPLLGVPLAIKDAFHVAGEVTTLGSVWHRHDRRVTDSGAVRRLRAAGAVFVGKTNVPEFCQSNMTDNLLGLPTANPWDPTRTAGGSSGGSAAAVASHSCLAALGSDGGGSIRIPASFTGLVGLKPTRGRVLDEDGFVGFADLGCAGPMAWRVDDVRRVFGVLADAPAARAATPHYRIGVCPRPESRPVDPGVRQNFLVAVAELDGLGHDVFEIDLPVHDWYRAFGALLVADEFDRRGHLLARPELLTPYERATLEAGEQTSPDNLRHAAEARARLSAAVAATFDDCDFVVTPTTAVPAFGLAGRPDEIDGHRVSRLWGATPFTAAFNLTGHPALALPSGLTGGLPTSVQLVGRPDADERLLDLAEDLEEALGLGLVARVPESTPLEEMAP